MNTDNEQRIILCFLGAPELWKDLIKDWISLDQEEQENIILTIEWLFTCWKQIYLSENIELHQKLEQASKELRQLSGQLNEITGINIISDLDILDDKWGLGPAAAISLEGKIYE